MSSQLRTLRIKIKSLAAEARFIRHEEEKEKKWWKYNRPEGEEGGSALLGELHLHRVHDVRSECRSANLAYGFLRGRYPYLALEETYHTKPDWFRVENLVLRFADPSPPNNAGKDVLKLHLKEWRTAKA